MQWRKKIAVLLISVFIITSCATSRKRIKTVEAGATGELNIMTFGETAKDYNINRGGFVIRKATIEMSGTPVEGKFGFSAKVREDGDFQASVRGPLGIELMRIITVKDSVYAVDRLNRVIYFGDRTTLLSRIKIPADFFQLLFGDIPEDASFANAFLKNNEELSVKYADKYFVREMNVRGDLCKISTETIKSGNGESRYVISFSEFKDYAEKRYPSKISIMAIEKMFHVKITVEEIGLRFKDQIIVSLPGYERKAL